MNDTIVILSEYKKKGKSALSKLRGFIESYNQYLMLKEENHNSAFHIKVFLIYIKQKDRIEK